VNLLREERLFLAKEETSIEVVPYVCCMQRMQHIFGRRLRLGPSDGETCTHALLGLIAPAIKDATRRRLLELPNNRRYHEGPQSSCENDDENEAPEAI